jgi:hypothetical protein
MKVVGTGAPRMRTVRFKSCELKVGREALRDRRPAVTAEAAEAQARAGARRCEVEDRHDELILVSRLLDDLRAPLAPDQPGRWWARRGFSVRSSEEPPRPRPSIFVMPSSSSPPTSAHRPRTSFARRLTLRRRPRRP